MPLPELTYEAQITFISRGSSRKGHFSTRQLRQSLNDAGYDVRGSDKDRPDNQLLQVVEFQGTREEVIRQREQINRIIRIGSNNQSGVKFKILKKS